MGYPWLRPHSRRGLIPGIQGSKAGKLAAIASRSEDTAKAWADEFSIPKAYGSYEALIADSRHRRRLYPSAE